MLNTAAMEQWLSPSEAARVLGLSAVRIRQMVAEGKLPAIRTALGRLVDADAVNALARTRKYPPTAAGAKRGA